MYPTAQSLRPFLLALASTLVLGACSSGSGSSADSSSDMDGSSKLDELTGDVRQFGFVDIQQVAYMEDNDVTFIAGFFGSDTPVSALSVVTALIPALDTCDIDLSDPDSFSVDEFFGADVSFLSAGDTIVVTGPAGTYTTLTQRQHGNEIRYVGDILTAPVSTDITIDIPGNTFPAFSAAAVPNVEVLTGASANPSSSGYFGFNRATVTTWDAGSDPDALMVLRLSGIDSATSATVDVVCTTADDGEFTLPQAIQAQIGENFIAHGQLSRVGMRFLIEGDVLLSVLNQSSVEM